MYCCITVYWCILDCDMCYGEKQTQVSKIGVPGVIVAILHRMGREGLWWGDIWAEKGKKWAHKPWRYLGGREFQAEGTLSAKALGQECAWLIPGRTRMPEWEEEEVGRSRKWRKRSSQEPDLALLCKWLSGPRLLLCKEGKPLKGFEQV